MSARQHTKNTRAALAVVSTTATIAAVTIDAEELRLQCCELDSIVSHLRVLRDACEGDLDLQTVAADIAKRVDAVSARLIQAVDAATWKKEIA